MSRFFVVTILVVAGLAGASAAEITVSAAASLKEALTEVAAAYEKLSGDRVLLNFAGSDLLARQIEAGAPVDLSFAADDASMDRLDKKRLVLPGTRRSILSNTLVIVVPVDSQRSVKQPADLANATVKRVALADPLTVPAGIYARQFLQSARLWDAVAPKVIPAANVRAALAAVASGNVEAGIVYRTDAAISSAVKIACLIEGEDAPSIRYPVALIEGGPAPDAARKFWDFLQTEPALEKFFSRGFLRVPKGR